MQLHVIFQYENSSEMFQANKQGYYELLCLNAIQILT